MNAVELEAQPRETKKRNRNKASREAAATDAGAGQMRYPMLGPGAVPGGGAHEKCDTGCVKNASEQFRAARLRAGGESSGTAGESAGCVPARGLSGAAAAGGSSATGSFLARSASRKGLREMPSAMAK